MPRSRGSSPVPSSDASELEPTTGTWAEHSADIAIPAIEFRNVDFSSDDKKVLEDLSFKLNSQNFRSRQISQLWKHV